MKRNYYRIRIILLLIGLGLVSCEEDDNDGKNSIVDFITEPAGANCSSGGFKIISGIDVNINNILDEDEIQNTNYICDGNDGNDGSNGNNSLLNIIPEPSGDNCALGGYKIINGIDINSNNILDADEIQNTEYVCNGNDGSNGYNSLLNIIQEPAGENCPSGGNKINSGLDLNNNNILDEDEIQNTEYICTENVEKETIIDLISNISNNSATPNVFPANIPHFDITTYNNLTSVTFVVYDIRTIEHTMNDITGEGTFELYDMTNNMVIENSTIQSDDIPSNTSISSINLLEYFPKEQINLGIRIYSGGDFTTVCGNVYLILSRE